MKFLTNDEARALDAATIAAGTPGIVLMERAAAAVTREAARALAARPERGARVAVLCGPGNNGGDGFEVARLLSASGVARGIETLLMGDPSRLLGDARTTFERLERTGASVTPVASVRDLEPLGAASFVVDALFGTGLTRRLDPDSLAGRAADLAGSGRAFVIAVDIPSGLCGDMSAVWAPSVLADVTVTFGAPKPCHVFAPAAGRCGRLVVGDIGLLPSGAAPAGVPEAVAAQDVAGFFPPRPAEAHKGDYGRLLVVGGSAGMAGAPALAARAALRAGVGLATVAAPELVRPIVHALSPESMTAAVDAEPSAFDALAVGPGLGRSEQAQDTVARLRAAPRPAVFDADALNLSKAELFAGRVAPTILTPHPGEAGRLLGTDTAGVNADRIAAARMLAARSKAVVILKGFRTVVAAPDGRVALILAGNPAMAKAGSGDVLTGVVGALLARGLGAWDAARAGAWLHGAAGDLAREEGGDESVVASDLVDRLPGAYALAREARPA